jgi:hypothetical protein
MKQNFLTLLLFLTIGFVNAQILPSDTIRFVRYIEDSDKNVSIPLTTLFYMHNTSFKSKFGWVSERSLQVDSLKDFLLIEMNTTGVPPGEWSDYTPGSFLLALEIDKGINTIKLDSINDQIHLLNNYATRGVNNPINTITGLLSFETLPSGKMKISGTITVDSKNPTTKHEIFFNNAVVPTTDYYGYAKSEKEYWDKQRKLERKMFDLTDRIGKVENNFYDSIFNYNLYPSNKIDASYNGNKTFEFKLDRSYVVEGAGISDTPSENLMDLLGSNIYYPVLGESVVINLHHFFEGKKSVIDDEINYSLLIALPNLEQKEYLINKNSESKAKLAYWHYGPSGHIIESKTVTGKILITKIEDQVVFGTIVLDFKSTDKKTFSINGEFQLPIVDKAEFAKLGQQIEKIINE